MVFIQRRFLSHLRLFREVSQQHLLSVLNVLFGLCLTTVYRLSINCLSAVCQLSVSCPVAQSAGGGQPSRRILKDLIKIREATRLHLEFEDSWLIPTVNNCIQLPTIQKATRVNESGSNFDPNFSYSCSRIRSDSDSGSRFRTVSFTDQAFCDKMLDQ